MPQSRHQIVPAAYLIPRRDNEVLLLRRFNTGYEDGNYSLVAGHVEQGETFIQTIVREGLEEAGITLHPDDLKMVHTMHRLSHSAENNERLDLFFQTTKWQGEVTNLEPDKCDDLSWHNLDKLPNNILPYIRYVLEAIPRGETYTEFGWTD